MTLFALSALAAVAVLVYEAPTAALVVAGSAFSAALSVAGFAALHSACRRVSRMLGVGDGDD